MSVLLFLNVFSVYKAGVLSIHKEIHADIQALIEKLMEMPSLSILSFFLFLFLPFFLSKAGGLKLNVGHRQCTSICSFLKKKCFGCKK